MCSLACLVRARKLTRGPATPINKSKSYPERDRSPPPSALCFRGTTLVREKRLHGGRRYKTAYKTGLAGQYLCAHIFRVIFQKGIAVRVENVPRLPSNTYRVFGPCWWLSGTWLGEVESLNGDGIRWRRPRSSKLPEKQRHHSAFEQWTNAPRSAQLGPMTMSTILLAGAGAQYARNVRYGCTCHEQEKSVLGTGKFVSRRFSRTRSSPPKMTTTYITTGFSSWKFSTVSSFFFFKIINKCRFFF